MTRNTKIKRDLRNHRYSYNHPVFYSRQHPFSQSSLPIEVRLAFLSHLSDTEPPF